MKINRDNYEAYFLDYHEGALTPDEMAEVLVFVAQNPDLKELFEGFENVSLPADESISFAAKDLLKKNEIIAYGPVHEGNYEEYLIAELEGLLNEDEKVQLETFISLNPLLEKERKLFALTSLQSDESVVFANKQSLHHQAIPTQNIHEGNFEEYFLQETEGLLDSDERAELEEFLALNPQLAKEHKLWAKTKLEPDLSVTYPDKTSLYRKGIVPLRRLVYYTLSAAASIIVLLGIYFTFENRNIPVNVAENKITVPENVSKPGEEIQPVKTESNNPSEVINTYPAKSDDQLASNNVPLRNTEKIHTAERDLTLVASLEPNAGREIASRDYVEPEFLFIRTSQMHINENLGLYYNLKLAEHVQYASLYEKDRITGKTVFGSLLAKAGSVFTGRKISPETQSESDLSLWAVAQLGVKTFSTVTKKDVELQVMRDDEGNVVSYGLTSPEMEIERSLKK